MKLVIKITKEVLEASFLCKGIDSKNCALAVAVREIFPLAAVGAWTMWPFGCTETNEITLPVEATKFISEFDRLGIAGAQHQRLQMPEVSFDINVPDSVIEKIGIEEAREIISKSSTLELA